VEMLDRAELEENTRKKVEKLIVEG